MSGKLLDSAWVPIFDRLVDLEPRRRYRPAAGDGRSQIGTEEKPWRIVDRDGLMRSIRVELHRLLNTRSHVSAVGLDPRARTVIDYGLPDYSALYTRDPEDHKRLAALVQSTVEAFEPRIRNVRVNVMMAPAGGLAVTEKSERDVQLRPDAQAPREMTVSIDSQRALLVTISGETELGQLMEPVSFELGAQEPDAFAYGQ